MADSLHNSLTNNATDGALHNLHLPGYSVADVATMNTITTGSYGDLAYVQSSGSYYVRAPGNSWNPLGSGFIGAQVYHNTNQSVANSGVTVLAFNSEVYDTDTIHDNSTNNSRLTATTAGRYHITGQVTYAAASGGNRTIAIRLDGTTLITAINRLPVASVEDEMETSTDYNLAAGQYVELVCAQSSSGAVNVLYQSDYSPKFSMHRIG